MLSVLADPFVLAQLILALVLVGGFALFVSGWRRRGASYRPAGAPDPKQQLPISTGEHLVAALGRQSRLASAAIVIASLALVGSAIVVGLRLAEGHDETADSTSSSVVAPTIGVIGRGTAPLVPDTAVVVMGLEGTWPTLAEVTGRVDGAVDAAVAAGAEPMDVRTVAYRVAPGPSGDASAPGQAVQVNYRVALTVRDLARLDAVLAVAVPNEVTVFGVGIGTADVSAPIADARMQAITDARARAEQIALGLGMTILHVDVAEELTGTLPPSPLALAVSDPSAIPSSPSMELTVEVVVRFAVR